MTVPVDPTNADQLTAWDGDQGAFWADHADRFDGGAARYHERLLDAARIGPADRVLDIGCGTGKSTRDAARRAAHALGVDLSSRMIEEARRRADREGVANVAFEQADAQVHPFPEAAFDVVISRHGVMFFGDPDKAFANIASALRPGGRMTLLTWQPLARNEFASTFRSLFAAGKPMPEPPPNAPHLFSLSDPDRVRALLTGAGMTDVELHAVSEPVWLGDDVEDALAFITARQASQLAELDDETKDRVIQAAREDMARHLDEHGVRYSSAAWIIQATKS
ncbi:class I SAM-dependent methyltransferase [Saccharothrix sp.]|uniref:class I SAM-dependent methyltransferase n=1 Tax=Saccharothrix sp. TaxID=1873460 RepID=UPI002811073E|nr:class I SAM-dependent methyltransferase [Saccharothrix sp.]